MGDAWIGTYEIRRFLGRGGMASVHECHDAALGRAVAVKVLHPHLAHDEIATARFLREGRAVSRVHHPNVVQMFDSGQSDGLPYLVMELVEGDDLAKYLRDSGLLPIQTIADFMLAVIAAVGAAHDVGIVHRDLKPSNIRLSRNHRGEITPKVLDFGISKLLADDDNSDLTQTNGVLGTASYMAPEQLLSARNADARSDVYSIGVILYECATGKLPFRGRSQYELMHAVLTEPVTAPSSLRPELPAALDAIVLRAMRRDPGERFATAHDLGLALAPFARAPNFWQPEFAQRAHRELSTQPTSAAHEVANPTVTLVSTSGSSKRPRWVRRAVLSGAVASVVLAVGLLGAIRRTTGSSPADDIARAQSASPSRATLDPVAPVARARPIDPEEPAHGSPPDAIPLRRRRPVRTQAAGAALRAVDATSHPAARQELGTNGAPILE
ncbi:MAG TPA: protein kinase [Polyangiaceae bacterium]|jgi:serine/threonine protein kinase|nr:protein kinase [Polyangiaceae bacterium]